MALRGTKNWTIAYRVNNCVDNFWNVNLYENAEFKIYTYGKKWEGVETDKENKLQRPLKKN